MQVKRLKSSPAKLSKPKIFDLTCQHIKRDSFKTLLLMKMLHRESQKWGEKGKQTVLELLFRSPSL